MSLLAKLGTLLRVRPDEVEAVLRHDDARAQATLKRRQFMGAAMAIATTPFVPQTWVELPSEPKVDWEQLKKMPWMQAVLGSMLMMGGWAARSQNDAGGLVLDQDLFGP